MQYSDSLKKNQDFQRVYRKGTSQANRYLVMYVLENRDGHMMNRLGISVSKKVGNSVVRHRLTRLIRESYRLNETAFQRGYDIVVIARNTAKDRTYGEIESALLHLAGRLHINAPVAPAASEDPESQGKKHPDRPDHNQKQGSKGVQEADQR